MMSERKTSTRMAAKHLAKPVRHRAGHAPTSISGVGEIVPKLNAPETRDFGTMPKKAIPGTITVW